MRQSITPMLGVGLAILAVSAASAVVIGSIGPWPALTVFRRLAGPVALAAVCLYKRRLLGERIRSWGLAWSASAGRELGWGLGLAVGWGGGVAMLLVASHALRWRVELAAGELAVVVLRNILAMAVVALLEETIFRGFLLQELLKVASVRAAVLVSSFGYALVHFARPLPEAPLALVPQWIGLWLFGVVLAWGYLKTRQLWFSIGLHWGAAALTLMDKHVLEFVTQPRWWSVGGGKLYDGMWGWVGIALLIPLANRLMPKPETP